MSRSSIVIALLALIAGWLGGAAFERPSLDNRTDEVRRTTNTAATGDATLLKNEIASLQQENRRLADELATTKSSTTQAQTNKADDGYLLPKDLLSNLSIEATNGDYKLTKDIIEFLQLTAQEVSSINASLDSTHQQLVKLQVQHAAVTAQTPSAITITVPAMKDEGAAIRSQLADEVNATVGDERGGYLMSQVDRSFSALGEFGAAKETLTVTAQPAGAYSVLASFQGDHGSYSTSATSPVFPTEYQYLFSATGAKFPTMPAATASTSH